MPVLGWPLSSNSGRTNWKYDKKTASFSAATAFAAYGEYFSSPYYMFDNECWNDHWSEFGKPKWSEYIEGNWKSNSNIKVECAGD